MSSRSKSPPGGRTVDEDLRLALRLADEADSISMSWYQSLDLKVSAKTDRTPVTQADLAVERRLREVLGLERPSDSILGEEEGGNSTPKGANWIIDPIDGTKNFLRGVPTWATLIALLHDAEVVVGVVSAPALGRRWYASRNSGSHLILGQGTATSLSVGTATSLAEAYVSTTELRTWDTFGRRNQYLALIDASWADRAFGDFFSHCMVAEGAIDVAVEPVVNRWDIAAVELIVREAGGFCTDLAGRSLGDPKASGALSTNRNLHRTCLQHFE